MPFPPMKLAEGQQTHLRILGQDNNSLGKSQSPQPLTLVEREDTTIFTGEAKILIPRCVQVSAVMW